MSPFLVIFLYAISLSYGELVPKVVSSFKTSHPGFITLARNSSAAGAPTWNVIIARFNGFPFSSDYVSLVRDIGSASSQLDSKVEDISNALHWPNEPGAIPEHVFQRGNLIIQPSGFLVPTKTQGALTIFDLHEALPSHPYQLTTGSDGDWFYHRAVWMDMDGDGKDDVVTCRAKKPIFGNEAGEMLWFKQPDQDKPWMGTWKETILSQGDGAPDTFLIPVNMTVGKGMAIRTLVTAGFFSKSLDIWWRKDETKPWTSNNLNKRVLDNSEGDTFDLIYADLNNDGKDELLVTYNKPANGTVFVYEIHGDFRNGSITKHMIFSGLDPAKSGTGKGAPGGVKLAWPNLSDKSRTPHIILSGDDNGKLYLLTKMSTSQWMYKNTVLLDASPGTMGAIAVGDIDNDNYTEIITPSYDDGKITILSYNPAAPHYTLPPTPYTTDQQTDPLHQVHSWIKSLFG